MILWHNLQNEHCIRLLVKQPRMNAAVVFSCQDCRKHQHLATCQLPQDQKLVDGLGIMEEFQNSPKPLHFTAFLFVTGLHALPLCPCMCPFTSSADDPQQQQVEQVKHREPRMHVGPSLGLILTAGEMVQDFVMALVTTCLCIHA